METWIIGFVASIVVSLAYFGISATILVGLARAGRWRGNPLALATGLIFLSCGLGHGIHAIHALEPATALAARSLMSLWHVWLVEALTAMIAVWYFMLRGRFPALVRGAALFEDMRVRQRQALDIHDNVVQGLVKAKMSIELGETAQGAREIEESLSASRKIMSDLLGDSARAKPLQPGDLVRKANVARDRL